jgi:hypothetical protein
MEGSYSTTHGVAQHQAGPHLYDSSQTVHDRCPNPELVAPHSGGCGRTQPRPMRRDGAGPLRETAGRAPGSRMGRLPSWKRLLWCRVARAPQACERHIHPFAFPSICIASGQTVGDPRTGGPKGEPRLIFPWVTRPPPPYFPHTVCPASDVRSVRERVAEAHCAGGGRRIWAISVSSVIIVVASTLSTNPRCPARYPVPGALQVAARILRTRSAPATGLSQEATDYHIHRWHAASVEGRCGTRRPAPGGALSFSAIPRRCCPKLPHCQSTRCA